MLCAKGGRAPMRLHPASLSLFQRLVFTGPIGFPGNFAMATNTFVSLKKSRSAQYDFIDLRERKRFVVFFLSMHITPCMDRRCIVTVRDELKMAQVDSD